jgi:hypothetical protein
MLEIRGRHSGVDPVVRQDASTGDVSFVAVIDVPRVGSRSLVVRVRIPMVKEEKVRITRGKGGEPLFGLGVRDRTGHSETRAYDRVTGVPYAPLVVDLDVVAHATGISLEPLGKAVAGMQVGSGPESGRPVPLRPEEFGDRLPFLGKRLAIPVDPVALRVQAGNEGDV